MATDAIETERIRLCYPPGSWYAENARELLQLVDEVAVQLEERLRLRLPRPTPCYVVAPDVMEALLDGMRGVAFDRSVVLGVPPRHQSEVAGVAAHELAHVLSHALGGYRPRFKGEGFACWAAWRIRADRWPMGLPLNYYLKWRLAVGIRTSLAELWERTDVSPELYDLGWSFAAFLVKRFGQECYFDFYCAQTASLEERIEATLDVSMARLERAWHEHADGVPLAGSQISRLHRYAGVLCGRAEWLNARGSSEASWRGAVR
jgi:hypothetical protein